MRLPTFYEQNLIPNWGNEYGKLFSALPATTPKSANSDNAHKRRKLFFIKKMLLK